MLSFVPNRTAAVLIGTSRCPRDPHSLPALLSVENSVHQLVDVLSDPSLVGMDRSRIWTLINETIPSEVQDRVESVAAQATDMLLFYFAGHGILGDSHAPLYFSLQNSTSAKAPLNAISMQWVRNTLDHSPARTKVVIIDCCCRDRSTQSGVDVASALRSFTEIEGTFVIACAEPDENTMAPNNETLTTFTGALIEVLRGGIEGTDGNELTLNHVYEGVRTLVGHRARAPSLIRGVSNSLDQFKFARNNWTEHDPVSRLTTRVETLTGALDKHAALWESLDSKVSALWHRQEWLEAQLRALGVERPDADAYEAIVRKLDVNGGAIPSGELYQARIVTTVFFETARRVVRILCSEGKYAANDAWAMYDWSPTVAAARNFLSKPGSNLKVLILAESHPKRWADHPMIAGIALDIKKRGTLILKSANTLSKEQREVLRTKVGNLIVKDDRAFRVEPSIDYANPTDGTFASFDNVSATERWAKLFDGAFDIADIIVA